MDKAILLWIKWWKIKNIVLSLFTKKKNDYFKLLKNFLEKTIAHVPWLLFDHLLNLKKKKKRLHFALVDIIYIDKI